MKANNLNYLNYLNKSNKSNKLYYEIDTSFVIYPAITIDDFYKINEFIDDNSFWRIDRTNSEIIVNDNEFVIENEIFNQLLIITNWLYANNYLISGKYHGITKNMIEHINISINDRMINHHVIYYPVSASINESNFCSKIIISCKKKMQRSLANYCFENYHAIKKISTTNKNKLVSLDKTRIIIDLSKVVTFIGIFFIGSIFVISTGN